MVGGVGEGSYDLVTSQRPHLLIASHWKLGFLYRTIGWGTQTSSIAVSLPEVLI